MIVETSTTKVIIREIPADLDTPISIYLKLRGQGASFLLESIEGGERIARYSFIGVAPKSVYILRDGSVDVVESGVSRTVKIDPGSDPFHFLQSEIEKYHFEIEDQKDLPRFIGGLVGYLSYESVRFFEPTLTPQMPKSNTPDGIYLMNDTIVAFDHVRRNLILIANVLDGDLKAGNKSLDDIEARILQPLTDSEKSKAKPGKTSSNISKPKFEEIVQTAKDYIAAGDIFQVVLSQRFSRKTDADSFDVYRAVRRINPSPYMFYFDFGNVDGKPFYMVGASPEMFVRLEKGRASLRPIAGTRPRGPNSNSDDKLADELLNDPKERAEHIMLVDLGRNDLGRVCEYGTVNVSEFFEVERYSHVMHIVSNVEGKLRSDLTAFDLVRAAFPAGTVSGAPKVRAMEIIAELEAEPRGPYAGMVGYFGFDGAMDSCLAIRTMVGHGKSVSVQAGAGIVADSEPANEYQETVNKASAMLKAIEIAEQA
ncbi:MAG: anthranilate synthase component I [Anaerolineae bacterium]|nr:anthranilate synthase component I [Anaerolineae bacterium]MDK1081799.1 anthranilate synthase component I [Anaerolineae bacterium]MDK1118934.1 anthranilate synthase component I [Anaerolineae bacterium]